MKRFVLLALVAAAVMLSCAKQGPVELKFGHYLVETHPAHVAAVQFA